MLTWAKRWLGIMSTAEAPVPDRPRSIEKLLETASGIAWDHSRSMHHPDAELVMRVSSIELQALEDEFVDDGPLNYMIEKDTDGVHIVTTLYGVRLEIVDTEQYATDEDWL